jgi:hypothetical protein
MIMFGFILLAFFVAGVYLVVHNPHESRPKYKRHTRQHFKK